MERKERERESEEVHWLKERNIHKHAKFHQERDMELHWQRKKKGDTQSCTERERGRHTQPDCTNRERNTNTHGAVLRKSDTHTQICHEQWERQTDTHKHKGAAMTLKERERHTGLPWEREWWQEQTHKYTGLQWHWGIYTQTHTWVCIDKGTYT